MSDDQDEDTQAFQEKIKSVQAVRKPHVEQKSADGSAQTYHTSGRVDANINIAAPIHGFAKTDTELKDKE